MAAQAHGGANPTATGEERHEHLAPHPRPGEGPVDEEDRRSGPREIGLGLDEFEPRRAGLAGEHADPDARRRAGLIAAPTYSCIHRRPGSPLVRHLRPMYEARHGFQEPCPQQDARMTWEEPATAPV